jgi:hypothetical protein
MKKVIKKVPSCTTDALWDECLEKIDSSDELEVEDINLTVKNHLTEFLEAGKDPSLVAELLAPRDVFESFDILISYGAEINPTKLAIKIDDVDFVRDNLDRFIEMGANVNILACYIFSPNMSQDELVSFMEKGIDINAAFSYIHEVLDANEDDAEELLQVFQLFEKYGLDPAKVKQWVDEHLNDQIVESIVDFDYNDWRALSINPDDYKERYLNTIGVGYITCAYDLTDLPKCITLQEFLDNFLMNDILENLEATSASDFVDFTENFTNAGGDIEALAAKFVTECGYSGKPEEAEAMASLVEAGSTTIDVGVLASSIDPERIDDGLKEYFYNVFETAGLDDDLLEKFEE